MKQTKGRKLACILLFLLGCCLIWWAPLIGFKFVRTFFLGISCLELVIGFMVSTALIGFLFCAVSLLFLFYRPKDH
mgnify:CR=1 FL=1